MSMHWNHLVFLVVNVQGIIKTVYMYFNAMADRYELRESRTCKGDISDNCSLIECNLVHHSLGIACTYVSVTGRS